MAKRVCLDAGHYAKYNRCPGNASYYESEVMWKLHLLQKKYLEQMGIEVVTTRAEQTKDLALTTRGQMAKGCDLFISNHTNAVGGGMNDSIDYVIAYHLTNDTNTNCDDISKDFASKIAKVVANTMGAKQGSRIASRLSDTDRNGDGVMNDNYYAVLNGTRSVNVPGIILEHSFHTNSKVVNWLLNDANLDKLAKAEAECIAKYLGVENNTDNSVPFLIKVDKVEKGDVLNIRKKPSAFASKTGQLAYNDPNMYTIVEVQNGWGRLKSGIGWINLYYTKFIRKC